MKKYSAIFAGLFVLMFAILATAQQPATKTLTITGTIVDSATGQPVAGAYVLFHPLDSLSVDTAAIATWELDTATSGSDGKFSYQMTVPATSIVLVYGVLKLGYQLKYDFTLIAFSTTVPLGNIKVVPSDANTMDTLTVSGTVVDSITGAPVPNALVAMSGLGGLDTAGNVALTGADGTFTKQVIISRINNRSVVAYIVTALDHEVKVGSKEASGKQLDLGTILLSPNNQAVLPRPWISASKVKPDRMSLFSLDGKLLYDGPVLNTFNNIIKRHTGFILVVGKKNNRIVESRQVFLTK